MLITEIKVIVYPQPGYEWFEEVINEPTWSQIEGAIRRLDRHEHPFLYLCLTPEMDGVVRDLNIIGGKGEYGLTGFDERDHERFRFRDLTRPDGPNRIEIWTSDQGAEFQETYLCNDLSVVLRIAKYFAETGGLDPSVNWEERGTDEIREM